MKYSNIDEPQATCWNIAEAWVEHEGREFRFWAEHELLMNEYHYEFIDEEPGAGFDWDQFDKDVREMLDNYDSFMEERNIEK